jgi:hypothetical protein
VRSKWARSVRRREQDEEIVGQSLRERRRSLEVDTESKRVEENRSLEGSEIRKEVVDPSRAVLHVDFESVERREDRLSKKQREEEHWRDGLEEEEVVEGQKMSKKRKYRHRRRKV